MRPGWHCLIVALALVSASASGRALAADAPRILVLGLPRGDELAAQLALDLGMLGFAVDEQARAATVADAESRAQARNAAAALLFLAEPSRREPSALWIVDRVTGKLVRHTLPAVAGVDARVRSQGVLELLRASLRDLDVRRQTPGADRAPSPPVEALIAAGPSPLAFSAGPAVWWSGGSVTPGLALAVRAGIGPRFVLGLGASAALADDAVSGPEGRALVRPRGAWAGLAARLGRAGHRLEPTLGLDGGVLAVRFVGQPNAPWLGAEETHVRPFALARAGIAWRLVGRVLALRADAAVGAAIGPIPVDFGGRRVTSWGLPVGLASLALEVALP